eukprot:3204157-Amphidinium_carterae.1
MYNFGFRTTCFGCKVGERQADQTKPEQATGRKPPPSRITKPWEQLEHQLISERDPEIRALLQKAAELKKSKANTQAKDLPLRDQRAKLVGSITRLTSAVDKQQEVLNTATLRMHELRRELATAHRKARKGDVEATAILQECVVTRTANGRPSPARRRTKQAHRFLFLHLSLSEVSSTELAKAPLNREEEIDQTMAKMAADADLNLASLKKGVGRQKSEKTAVMPEGSLLQYISPTSWPSGKLSLGRAMSSGKHPLAGPLSGGRSAGRPPANMEPSVRFL